MSKRISFIFAALALALLLTVYAAAASVDATDSLLTAVEQLNGEGGTVVLQNDITVADGTEIPEQSGNLIITTENGSKLTLAGSLVFAKNTNSNVIELDVPVEATAGILYGGFNSVTFTENFSVTGTLDFYGGFYNFENTNGATTNDPEGYYAKNQIITTELPYTITVNGGTFRHFMGGNYRDSYSSIIGSIAAPITIEINAGTFGEGVTYTADTALKVDKAFSISGMSILADNANLTINGGTFNTPIYAQGYIGETSTRSSAGSQYVNSDPKFYAIDGNIEIEINGGELNGFELGATQITAAYQQLVRGNYTVTVGEDATLASGMIFDATQVKAYTDGTKTASITYPAAANVKIVRFDTVNNVPQQYDEPTRIACIGDSITQGTAAKINGKENFELGSYPAQLYKKMFDLGEDIIVANYGCGATKVMDYGGLGYTLGLAYTLSMKETDPDIVIFGLGTNDANATSYTYGMQDRFYEEYSALVSGYEALDSTDMVYGTSATYRTTSSKVSDLAAVCNVRGLQKMALNALRESGKAVTYIDLYALTLDKALAGEFLSSDNLHPDYEGYTFYAETIYNAIRNGKIAVENFEMTDIYVDATKSVNAICTEANPTSSLSIAFAKAADNATIHIIGEYVFDPYTSSTVNYGFPTPVAVKGLTIKGYGDGASIKLNNKQVHIKNDATFDNIKIYSTASGALHFACGYHNVTFTESFDCGEHGLFAAGFVTFGENKSSGWYNSRESVSSDRDCVITVNGGTYDYFLGGNFLNQTSVSKAAIYGTYSGNMTINIGPNVTIKDNVRNGACGQNYLTGNITLNAAAWASTAIREFGYRGATAAESTKYDLAKNTGTVTINLLGGLERTIAKAVDLNNDGKVNFADTLKMLDYVLNGLPADIKSAYYAPEINLSEVLRMLKAHAN